jgi:hypothetical protein
MFQVVRLWNTNFEMAETVAEYPKQIQLRLQISKGVTEMFVVNSCCKIRFSTQES